MFLLRLLLRLGLGDWKKDKALKEWKCKTLQIKSRENPVLLSLDGETKTFDLPLNVSILPKHLRILIPEDPDT